METDINIPEKLIQPIFQSKKKHRLIKGGRGGAKSESVARALIVFALMEKGNILCTRSVQNSIKDSVYSVLARVIEKQGLTKYFEIKVNEIVSRSNGNKIMFKGCNSLSDPKSEAAKGLDEIRICWVEEAHTISERDIDILLPSIRMNGSFFFWTYNSNKEPCVVKEYFENHSNAEFTEIQYYENPFLPETLYDEAMELKRTNEQKYREIWLGEPSTDTTKNIIIGKWFDSAVKLYELKKENMDGATVYGLDIADEGADSNALAERSGFAFMDIWERDTGDTIATADWAVKLMKPSTHLVYDRVGVGAGVKARLREKYGHIDTTPYSNGDAVANPIKQWNKTGIKNKDMFANFGAQHWFYIRELFMNSEKILLGEDISDNPVKEYITIRPDIKLIRKLKQQLLQIEFDSNPKGQIIIVKTPEGFTSPNLADAFMMSFKKPKKLAGIIF